jgi:serine/threonine protein kinase/Tol biopolymer transport system component
LGPYEIISPIGAGGMGEVFKACDVRLDRIVAVKVSKEQFSERFDREARAVASLNHSNICTLLDVGPNYLVMEYLEGTALKGPLPLDQALNYAAQLCDALDAAHRKGITHRDLKPANILVTKTGIKLLDFGVAKFGAAALGVAAERPGDATLTMELTGRNEIVGTLYYMSPEQLQAKGNCQEIDARSDIFSFGLVLYEMLTGKRAFEGASPASVIAAIMERPAPSVGKLAPAALDRAVRKCLAKGPDERWQTARDLKDELVWIAGTLNEAPIAAASTSRPRWPWITAAFLAVTVAVLSVILIRQPELAQPVRFDIPFPAIWQRFGMPVLSPNGEWLVTAAAPGSGTPELWLRPLNGVQMQRIPGTEGGTRPFWSPDSRSIAFIAGGKLKRVDLAGGLTQTLCEVNQATTPGTWNRDGVILLGAYGGAIQRVAAEGEELRPVTTLDARRGDRGHTYPVFLPDQRRFFYHADGKEPTLRIASLDGSEEATLPISSPLVAYAPPGYLLYARENTVMARRFDPTGHTLAGEAFPVAEHVATSPPDGAALFSVSTNGILAWRKGTLVGLPQLTWFDRTGNVIGKIGEPADYSNPVLSPDERHLAVCVRDPQSKKRDIWLFDLVRGSSSRFTFDPADDTNPVWSPDGAKIAFSSDRKGHRDLYWKNSSGTGEDELIFGSTLDKSAEYWSPDGRFLLFNEQANSGLSRADIMMLALPARADSKPQTVIASPFNDQRAEVSPDGKFLLYYSNETRRYEAYVQNFPPAGGKWQVSTAGASDPHWSGNGKEIVYVEQNRLMATPVRSNGGSFEPGVPKRLFEVSTLTTGRNSIAVSHDGKRFLISTIATEDANAAPFTVLVNWATGVKH